MVAGLSPDDASARVRAIFGDVVNVKPVHAPVDVNDQAEINELLTRVCYYYPQYTLEAAEMLTNSQVNALLLQAEKQKAIEFYNLTMISAAPHSKKGQLVGKLIKEYKKIVEM